MLQNLVECHVVHGHDVGEAHLLLRCMAFFASSEKLYRSFTRTLIFKSEILGIETISTFCLHI